LFGPSDWRILMSENHHSDILFAFGVMVALAIAWYIRDVLLLIYISALFAVVLGPGVQWVQRLHIGKWHPNRGLAMILLIGVFVALITMFFVFALPPIFRDVQQFSSDLPGKIQRLQDRLHQWPLAQQVDPSMLKEHVVGAVGGIIGLFKGVAGGVVGFFSFLILLAYFIIDGQRAFEWALSLFSRKQRMKLRETMVKAEARVSKWLLGQFALMLILGSLSAVVFGLLHVKYFVALAVFMGIANIVPIVGPVISVTLAAIVAAFDSWSKAIAVLVFYLVYQQIENAFLTPKIMKSTVDLPALAVIIALAVGGALAGILGALVAVPTAALIAVVIDEYVVEQ
jgi:predicted PurR-regulated permease PerM